MVWPLVVVASIDSIDSATFNQSQHDWCTNGAI